MNQPGIKTARRKRVGPKYGVGSKNASLSDGGSGSMDPIFRASFDTSIVPEVGTAGTYARAGTAYFNNSPSTISTKAANQPCVPAYVSGLATAHGFQQMHDTKNWILHSEDFTNAAWVAVGTGATAGNTAVAPDGNTTADTISGGAGGDGITQDSGLTSANTDAYIFSVWLRATSGTPSVDLVIKDTVAQSNTNTVVLSTTWKRYAVYYKFAALPVGNVFVQILVGNTNTVRAWGAQLDISQAGGSTTANNHTWAGNLSFGGYVPTTTAPVAQAQDQLHYTGSEVTTSRTQVSLIVWVYRPTFTDVWTRQDIVSQASTSLGTGPGVMFSESSYVFNVNYGGNTAEVSSTSAGVADRFNQIIVVCNYDTDTYVTYMNGAQVHTDSTARAPLASYDYLAIGHRFFEDAGTRTARTIIGRVELYPRIIGAGEASTLYNTQKTAYGL